MLRGRTAASDGRCVLSFPRVCHTAKLVVLLGWDATSDATSGIPNISFTPRDQVHVRMFDGLSRVSAAVHADIEAGHGGILGFDNLLAVPK